MKKQYEQLSEPVRETCRSNDGRLNRLSPAHEHHDGDCGHDNCEEHGCLGN